MSSLELKQAQMMVLLACLSCLIFLYNLKPLYEVYIMKTCSLLLKVLALLFLVGGRSCSPFLRILEVALIFFVHSRTALTHYLISDPICSLFLLKLITHPELIYHFSAKIFLNSINKPLSLLLMQKKHHLKQ